jgi:hypothetical protein
VKPPNTTGTVDLGYICLALLKKLTSSNIWYPFGIFSKKLKSKTSISKSPLNNHNMRDVGSKRFDTAELQ